MLLSETSGVWARGVEAKPPAGASSNPYVSLQSVSCASAGDCSAVGSYTDNAGEEPGLLVTETSGVWHQGVKSTPPANASSPQTVILGSVSCATAGSCSAVGYYNAVSSPTSQGGSNLEGVLLNASPASPALTLTAPASATLGSPVAPGGGR